jgi:hypothetical protein
MSSRDGTKRVAAFEYLADHWRNGNLGIDRQFSLRPQETQKLHWCPRSSQKALRRGVVAAAREGLVRLNTPIIGKRRAERWRSGLETVILELWAMMSAFSQGQTIKSEIATLSVIVR